MADDIRSLFRAELVSARPYVVGARPDDGAKLGQNENPFDLPDDLKRRLSARFLELPLNRYPREQPRRLAAALADYAQVPASHVLVTHGSNEFVHSLCLAFVEKGREVVLPTPMFSLFGSAVDLFGGTIRRVPARSDFTYDVDALVEAVGERPRLAILACPNNPTGKDLPLRDIERILVAAHGFTVVDEAYLEFTDRKSAGTLLDRYPRLIVMRTLSKAFGLAAVRIGYVVANPGVIEQLLKVRLPFMVDPFAEEIALSVLAARDEILKRTDTIRALKERLVAGLAAIEGVEVVPSDTNFVLFRAGDDADTIQRALLAQGVGVRSMAGYAELRQYLRVSAGSDGENRSFLDALKSAVDRDLGSQGSGG
jgi:histidinol-phosphate aminotransferase